MKFKKATICCILTLFISFMCIGCYSSGADQGAADGKSDMNYVIQNEDFKYDENGKNYSVSFPQFIEFQDDYFVSINNQIKDYAMNIVNHFGFDEDFNERNQRELLRYEISYEITYQSGDFISILFHDYYSHSDAVHPNKGFKAFVFDLKNHKQLPLSDIISIDDSFITLLLKQIEIQSNDHIYDYLKNNIGEERLLERFLNYELNGGAVDYYITKDGLGICVETIYAIGNYLQIIIPAQDLDGYIKGYNIWGEEASW